jgi:hypothetical protein
MDRFDDFLSNYLFVYLENELIQEIIITDENGEDIKKIQEHFDHPKLRLFQNEKRLGALLNKHKAASLAQNEWIVLIDSYNLADYDYFETAKNYIESIKDQPVQNVILAPCFAKPLFDFTHLSGVIFKKGEIEKIRSIDKLHPKSYRSDVLMNAGNYIIHKHLIEQVDLSGEDLSESNSCDVILFNMILFEQLDLHLHVVKDLKYTHVCHSGSIYLKTCDKYRNFAEKVHKRYYDLI